jgi:(p)ppGpp synthase/HD superfamily hydrolase
MFNIYIPHLKSNKLITNKKHIYHNNIKLTYARQFSLNAHGSQKYGDKPYIYHLDSVVDILFPYSDETKIIGYLHDVVEDTNITHCDLTVSFNEFIADCVLAVTDELNTSREANKYNSNKKFQALKPPYYTALIVKAADRLANLNACIEFNNETKLKRYLNEHIDFKKAVYRKGLCDDIWKRLDIIFNTRV